MSEMEALMKEGSLELLVHAQSFMLLSSDCPYRHLGLVLTVPKSPWRTFMASKSLKGEGNSQRERKYIGNSKRKPWRVGDFQNIDAEDFHDFKSQEKIHANIYFVSPS